MTSPRSAATPIRIGILETGRPPEELEAAYGNYALMVQQWIEPLDAIFEVYAILEEHFPENASCADFWIITGSKFGAYEEHGWIRKLEAFIREAYAAKQPMFGICFGHQIIAKALGGVVKKSSKGWGIGVHEYLPSPEWPGELGPAPKEIRLQAFHQDQVEAKPEGAILLATSDFCEHAALWYPGFAFTVQGHPEFNEEYAQALIETRRNTLLKEMDTDRAIESTASPNTRFEIASLLREHLTKLSAAQKQE